MCDPSYFEVRDVKNPFMDGNVDAVDAARARVQWEELRAVFARLGYPVAVIPGQPGLEDMVFAANQVLVCPEKSGGYLIVTSNMRHESRRREVPHFESFFAARGYRVLRLAGDGGRDMFFEGHGDAIWHPGKRLLWGGWGHRTEAEAYEKLCRLIDVPVVALNLLHPQYYHLDTAFCALDERSVMIYPGAFDSAGLSLIRHYFENVLEVPESDAGNFACNALALGRHVVLQRGSTATCAGLRQLGFIPVEVDTSEFMKSGGSVFCMKMEYYGA